MNDRDWAARHAPRLVEEARAEALTEARALLRRRMVDALLEAADEPARAATRSTAADAGTGSPARARTGIWVYGVVAGDMAELDGLAGVDDAAVRVVRAAGLAALASPVRVDRVDEAALEDVERLEAVARAHQAVLDRALALGGVIPFRLCTLYSDEAHVRELLERGRASLAATLERLRDSAEWGVKAYLVDEPAPAAAGAAASGTEWLERRRDDRAVATAAQDEAEERAATVHARLAEHAAAAVLSRPHDRRLSGHEGEMLLNGAYLVPSARADEFAALVDRLRREHERAGLRLELTGPWAPYHFVGEE